MSVSVVPKKTFNIPLNGEEFVEITIAEPDLRADNLNITTWTSSFILASQLHKLNVIVDDDENIPILELGAGTGLVGLTAAILWRREPFLTDLAGIVPGLRTNIDLNAQVLASAAVRAQCGSLDWTSPKTVTLDSGKTFSVQQTKANIIFAADTIYDEAHPKLLSQTILTWLARTSNARAILTYPLRVCYLDQIREIWTLLEEGGMVAESDGQEQADTKDWDDECLCEWVVWKWNNL
ncbi:hypothetical protein H2198_006967 [Neophaeococcomyces mojaviensis]|uniref:Uncharacterized protein n=1 Tax=Neophaeococcomyces mojaviensis TaxID=3383035 RepID=A0ACC3A1D6_9EURO|nr:hypothetical protein H2198_006967 [Knufia sp. JES_112]